MIGLAGLVAAAVATPFALLSLIPAFFLVSSGSPQILFVNKTTHKGIQQDLFAPANSYADWNQEITLCNPLTGTIINIGSGVIEYIEKYGFYEGGENNSYRIDPVNLIAILTGASTCTVRAKN